MWGNTIHNVTWTFDTWSRDIKWLMYIVISTPWQGLQLQTLIKCWVMMSGYHLQSNMILWSHGHVRSRDIWKSWQVGNLWWGLSSRKATWSFDCVVTWYHVTNKNCYVNNLRRPTTTKLDRLLPYIHSVTQSGEKLIFPKILKITLFSTIDLSKQILFEEL